MPGEDVCAFAKSGGVKFYNSSNGKNLKAIGKYDRLIVQ